MLACFGHVQDYTASLNFDSFSNNFMAAEACLYNIQIIGEAVSLLPEEVKALKPQVPWALIKGMRNRLIHDYFGTDLQVVWNVITLELPILKANLLDLHKVLTEN